MICCEVNDPWGLCCQALDFDDYFERVKRRDESRRFHDAPEEAKQAYREGRMRYRDVIDPIPEPVKKFHRWISWRSSKGVEDLLREALAEVAASTPGERNNTLNRVSFLIGRLIQSGSVSMEHAVYMLGQAARDANLPLQEAAVTVEASIRAGMRVESESPYAGR